MIIKVEIKNLSVERAKRKFTKKSLRRAKTINVQKCFRRKKTMNFSKMLMGLSQNLLSFCR
jgi:hypothetical protein